MLTHRQKQVRDFVEKTISRKSVAPSEREIAKHFRIAPSTVHEHLKEIEERGYLNRNPGKRRGISIRKNEGLIKIPLLGAIAAGEPIHVFEEQRETIAVPKSKIYSSSEVYALRVVGNSMVDENINDGDIILVKQQTTAENGQKVVALLNGNEATLKTFYKENGRVRLQPANKNFQPIIVKNGQELALQGVLLDVIKTNETIQPPPTFILPSVKFKTAVWNKIYPYFQSNDDRLVLYHGNCLDILNQLPSNSIDMIFADPPYNLSNGGFSLHSGKRVSVNKGNWDKSKGFKDDYNFHYKWLSACKRVLKPNGTLWVSGTYHSIYQCGYALQSLGYHIMNDITWFKPNGSPNLSCRYFTASHETLIWARKDKNAKHFFNYNLMKKGNWPEDFIKKPNLQMRSVWAIYPPKKAEKVFGKHPTQKPVELLKRIILASTKSGAVILDPFTGSSTTGIASEIIGGRKFIGIDTERDFLDVSIRRFKEMQSLSPKR